ncbi:type II toxin-antitoxin system RelE/ParE family toxin [Fulvimarina endophytica]|uniref:Type II toxin-antitoxin system RelE/ParE family toxin n=1 Tax=Fulvimarina endophytica TaxID=2293836 RepID=A0A371X0J7_9HYPH|nr:type II toxin-antitoxin system RelE/ParE family toxin [Fulvimarina endophytica]RFC62729.1 type II toxin-antitoxin system RelE/ParE family toxin [Fulvimarina endophytica]
MKRIKAEFFETDAGNLPVRDWLKGLNEADCCIVGRDIATVEFGWPVGMPTCKPVRGGLREVRSTIKSGKVEARVYFAIEGGVMLLLHGHEGKSGQDVAIDLAISRHKAHKSRKK